MPPSPADSSSALRVSIDNYREAVAAYYQFMGIVHPVLDGLSTQDDQHLQTVAQETIGEFKASASEEDWKEFGHLVQWMMSKHEDPEHEDPEKPAENLGAPPIERESRKVSSRVASVLTEFIKRSKARAPAGLHREILHRGVLTGLVGQFEVLVSDLAHHFLRRAPGALGQEKVLSVGELLSFATFDEAIEHVVADKVDELLRGSAEDWRKFFDTRLKVNLAVLAPEWQRFVEYIQRRHLIVHAGSRVSRRYLSNVDSTLIKEYFPNCKVGQPVPLPLPYVEAALAVFETTGILLGCSCWVKPHGDHAEAQSSFLDDYVYESVRTARWPVVRALASWGANQDSFGAASRVTFRFNEWLARKRSGSDSGWRAEAQALDCTALRPVFSMAKAALLDDHEGFFAIVEQHGGELDNRAWTEWPILDEMRADARFGAARARFMNSVASEPSLIAGGATPEVPNGSPPAA